MAPRTAARIPQQTNIALASFIVAVHAAVLIALPALGVAPTWMAAAVGVAVLFSPLHWSLIHEAIHGLLLPRRAANDRVARVLAILFGVPFRAVRFAHLRHHRYNRTAWGREEVYDPAARSTLAAYAMHYGRITFGLYLGEIALSALCWMPRSFLRRHVATLCPDLDDGARGMAGLADRDVLSAEILTQIRIDAVCLVSLYVLAFALYGAHWPILAALLALRALIASQLDHAPHHDTPLDQRDHALNMTAPRWVRALLLNFNFHRTHHQHPNLPWTSLPGMSDTHAADIPFVRAVLRQWRGPIALTRMPGATAGSP